jgi:hypothetical protein
VRTGLKVVLAAFGVAVIALAWGYWHAQTHASLSLRVDDYGLKTNNLAYGSPHDVTLTFLGPANEPLAIARSVEPLGYILAVHPNKEIGNCEHRGIRAAAGQAPQSDHADCYADYSAWSSKWAPLVRRAHVVVGKCEVRDQPVGIYTSNDEWWLWWVPLPHIGGIPRRHFEFSVRIDSRTCAGVSK